MHLKKGAARKNELMKIVQKQKRMTKNGTKKKRKKDS